MGDWSFVKLDGLNSVDNRPSTDKLHHFIKNKQKKHDTWHVTGDTWNVTRDIWHVTRDMWQMVGVDILSKFQLPSSYGLG